MCLHRGPVCKLGKRSFTEDLTDCKRRFSIWNVSLCGSGARRRNCFTRKSVRHVRLAKEIFANSVSLYGGCERNLD
jgi:hypothetical protein